LGGGAIEVSSDTVRIKPGTSALVTVVPVKFPYMDPEAVSVRVKEFVRKGQKAGSPISIASISGRIGGTAIDFQPLRNSMMNNGKFSNVNWPVFSTVGLARELQFVARNNSKRVIEVTISVRGKPVK